MEIQLQELIDKIEKDGIASASEEASHIAGPGRDYHERSIFSFNW